ncbi:MAG TPA: hypothetical protein VGN70_01225 [Gammaproteobacteria bacterium]|jgi:hypothetical protein
MHASIEQLIGLRDEEPVSVEVQQHVRGCTQCAAALNGLLAARERVAALTDPSPPGDAWQRITAARDRSLRRRRWLPAAGLGLAATAAAAALLITNLHISPAPTSNDMAVVSPSGDKPADVNQLRAQSRYLERAVLKLDGHADDMAVTASTASTIAALEDRIALVDYEINTASGSGVSNDDPHVAQLWKQRVDLLQSLAAVRYAQVADAGI